MVRLSSIETTEPQRCGFYPGISKLEGEVGFTCDAKRVAICALQTHTLFRYSPSVFSPLPTCVSLVFRMKYKHSAFLLVRNIVKVIYVV